MRFLSIATFAGLLMALPGVAQTRYYGAIDLGSRGIKAFLFSFEKEGEGRDAKSIYKNEINTKLVSSAQNGRFTEAGILEATQATATLVTELKAQALRRNLRNVEYYVVASSGVAKFGNMDDLKSSVDKATGLSLGVVNAQKEGYFGLISAVPNPRRPISILVDIGSSNSKFGCLQDDEFLPGEIPLGSVTGRNAALKADPNFKVGLDKVMEEQVAPGYAKTVEKVPCLANRQRIYWIGGAAWATATFTHPEAALWGYVNITRSDIDKFLVQLNDGTWNQTQPQFRFSAAITPAQRQSIRTANLEDRKRVQDVFSREDLLSGVSIMKTIVDKASSSAVVYFVRNGNYLFGYALDKYREDTDGAPVSSNGPTYFAGIDLGSKGIKAYVFSFVKEGEGPDARSLFKNEINTKLVSGAKGNHLTPEGIAEATSAVVKLLGEMHQFADKKGIKPTFYVVASSGVARFENHDELKGSIDKASGLPMDFVSVQDEGRFGLISSVPENRRQDAVHGDIGSSNTKLGCLTRDIFNPAEIPYGSVTLRNAALGKMKEQGGTDYPAALDTFVKTDVNPAYNLQRMNTPCLGGRDRIYAIGGAPWAVATFTVPEAALWGYVPLSRKQLDGFLSHLKDGTYQNEPTFYFGPRVPEDQRQMVRSTNAADRKRVQDVFSKEDLLAGATLLKTILDQSKPSAQIWFVRNGNYLFGYALEKYRQNLRMGEDTVSLATR